MATAAIKALIDDIRSKIFKARLDGFTKADMAGSDLCAGGAKGPQQGKPFKQPKKKGEKVLLELELNDVGIVDALEALLNKIEVSKPFAGYRDFDACVLDQKSKGSDADTAEAICGQLQSDAEKGETHVSRQLAQQLTGEFDRMVASVKAMRDLLATDETEERVVKVLSHIEKAPDGEQRYALGIVLEPDVVDAQGDTYNSDEIRKAAWQYMINFRNVGLMHKGFVNGKAYLVESYIAPADMMIEGTQIKKGTWMLGLHVEDAELWAQVQSGGLTGLSIGGFAKKTPV